MWGHRINGTNRDFAGTLGVARHRAGNNRPLVVVAVTVEVVLLDGDACAVYGSDPCHVAPWGLWHGGLPPAPQAPADPPQGLIATPDFRESGRRIASSLL